MSWARADVFKNRVILRDVCQGMMPWPRQQQVGWSWYLLQRDGARGWNQLPQFIFGPCLCSSKEHVFWRLRVAFGAGEILQSVSEWERAVSDVLLPKSIIYAGSLYGELGWCLKFSSRNATLQKSGSNEEVWFNKVGREFKNGMLNSLLKKAFF